MLRGVYYYEVTRRKLILFPLFIHPFRLRETPWPVNATVTFYLENWFILCAVECQAWGTIAVFTSRVIPRAIPQTSEAASDVKIWYAHCLVPARHFTQQFTWWLDESHKDSKPTRGQKVRSVYKARSSEFLGGITRGINRLVNMVYVSKEISFQTLWQRRKNIFSTGGE